MRSTEYAVTRPWHRALLALFDAIGALLLRRRRRPGTRVDVSSLLLIRRGHFGDLVLLQPAIARARELFPRARITLLTSPEYRDWLAAAYPALQIWCPPPLLARRPRFDLALDFHAELGPLLLGRLCARRLAGYGIRGGGFLPDHTAPYPWRLPAAARHVHLVETAAGAAAGSDRSAPPRLAPAPDWQQAAARLLADLPRPFVLVHPGCGSGAKRWPPAHWRQLLARCRQRGLAIVLTGSDQDRALCAWIAVAEKERIHDLSGQTDWSALSGLVQAAAAVIAPDTGIIHLAQALGTPTVALFGPTDPAVWGYEHGGHRSLSWRLPCSYCDRGRCPRREVKAGDFSPCMQLLQVAEVMAAIEAPLAASRGGRAVCPAGKVGAKRP